MICCIEPIYWVLSEAMDLMINGIDRIVKPSKLTQTITDKLRSMISEGILRPGDKLPTEKELCDGFGVGRSSVREALGSLEHMGLIESRPGVGRFLSADAMSSLESFEWSQQLERASTFDLMEARKHLEVLVATLAAERATDESIATLEGLLEAMRAAGSNDLDAFFDSELRFHLTLSKACGNLVLTELVNALIHRISGDATRFLRTLPYTCDATLGQFGAILQALKDGNADLAGKTMDTHLDLVREVLNKGLTEGEADK